MVPGEIREAPDSLYRLLVESITDYAVFMLDLQGDVTSWNAGAAFIFRYKAEEVIGENYAIFLPHEGPRRASDLLAMAAREHRFEVECILLRHDRTPFSANVVIDAVQKDETLLGYAVVVRDLSERRRAQDDLRRSEENVRLLVQSVEDYAIFMLDRNGRVTNWNAGAQRIKGYRPEDIIGEHYSRFYSKEDCVNGEPQKNLVIAERDGKVEVEGWRYRKDGTKFWAWVVITAIRDDARQLIGFAKVTRDMTASRESAEALRKAQEHLFQSQKIESLGQLTGGVAHDFNNLLQIISSSINLAYKRVDDAKAMRLLGNALMAADRGATVTRRMLAFARRQPLKPQSVDLHALFEEIYGLISSALGPGISLRRDIPRQTRAAHIDPHQLEAAILNLCLNSKDAMPEGGELSISAHSEDLAAGNQLQLPSGHYIRLSVSDQGSGMDQETLRRAAEPFFTTKGPGKGIGLGLSMIHGLLEQSGGKLVLKGEPQVGTVAELWIPAAESGANAAPAKALAESAVPTQKRLTILNVDDDVLVRLNTTAMLEDMGHDVIDAGSGGAALDHFARRKIDLLITDQAMPHMTGLQLAQRLREIDPRLPILVATGYAELSQPTLPEMKLLNKPFMEHELREAVELALKPSKTPRH